METLHSAKTYFAVQCRNDESPDELAKLILQTAKARGLRFTGLEYMGRDSFGNAEYYRFRTDLGDISTILDRLQTAGRGVVSSKLGGFVLKMPGGRHGLVSSSRMYALPRQGRLYRGTAMKLWEEQFAAN